MFHRGEMNMDPLNDKASAINPQKGLYKWPKQSPSAVFSKHLKN